MTDLVKQTKDGIDWHVIVEAVSEAISNAEGQVSAYYLEHYFRKAEIGVFHAPDLPVSYEEHARLQSALTEAQAQGEVMRAALVTEAQRWGNEALAKSAESSRRANRLGNDPFGHGDMAREGADHLNTAGRELLAFAEHMKTFALQSTPPTALARVIEAEKKVVEAARVIFEKRKGAFGSALWERLGPAEFVLDVEALRAALADLDAGRKG